MSTTIERFGGNDRLSSVVVHGSTVYLSGVTAADRSGDITTQTRAVLAKIDRHLEDQGTDRSRILYAQIWLRDISRDFAGMNEVWTEWLAGAPAPSRATAEAALASEDVLVEIVVTAAR